MKNQLLRPLMIALCCSCLAGCDKLVEFLRYTPDERAAAESLKPIRDPVSEEIYKFRVDTRQAYNHSRFDELERIAAEVRATKSIFGNGSWKIVEFYESLACREDEPESMWELHDQIHRNWIAAKPQSITAQVAYADFLTEYGWHARGHGLAKEVPAENWKPFNERVAAARKIIEDTRFWPEKDPYFVMVAFDVALGQGWRKPRYDALVEEAHAFEPSFWRYDTKRAISLLPRWYGKPGDWEAYAEQTSARPDSLGPELYARLVVYLSGSYDDVFTQTKASWPKTRAGLEVMRQKYPEWLEPWSDTARLAIKAHDYALARQMFDRMGDNYVPDYWGKPVIFAHLRKLAETH